MTGGRTLITLVCVLALSFVLSLFLGGADVGIGGVLQALLDPQRSRTTAMIIRDVRLPRVVLGTVVGAGLGVTGAVLQGMLRNPLAESYTLGVSGGAALGTILGGILLGRGALAGFASPVCAFLGALASTAGVYVLAARRRFSASVLILSGIVLNLLLSSLLLLLFALLRKERVFSMFLWLIGDISTPETGTIAAVSAFVLAGAGGLLIFAKDLNLLTLGEEKATYLGVEVETVHKILFVLTSLVAGACVSAAGIVGFVGLLVPHLVRQIAGPDHRIVLPSSLLAGGSFLILCDAVARSVASPVELPVGVVTGILGGIFFLFYLVSGRSWESF